MRYVLLAISFLFLFPISAHATAYYVDFTVDIANGNGLSTTTPFNNLDSFTEVARSAGDIAFVRRNTASTTNVSDLNFTSDGTIANPIIISADNDNLWNDASTTAQTYTVAIATSTFTASAAITGMQAGDWFYVAGDCTQTYNSTSLNQCEYFYEVAWISGTQLGLYMPYTGNQSGAGLALTNLGKNPQWNVASGDFQWNFDTDDYWLVKGMDIRGTDSNGQVELDSSQGHSFSHTTFTGNDASASAIVTTDDISVFSVMRSRIVDESTAINLSSLADVWGYRLFTDTLFQSSATQIAAIGNPNGAGGQTLSIFNSTFLGGSTDISGTGGSGTSFYFRNTKLSAPTQFDSQTTALSASFFSEDFNQTLGDNRQAKIGAGLNTNTSITLSTSTLRSGGGPTAIEVHPTTNTTSIWDFNKIKLFEYPIYTDTSSKQYDVYFRNATSTEFTANPTASELWIQCEYWAHDTGATSTRKITKSTDTIDFAGSTAWDSLTVTCDPSQEGILYLSGWYGKTKENGQSNVFLMDNTPIIQ